MSDNKVSALTKELIESQAFEILRVAFHERANAYKTMLIGDLDLSESHRRAYILVLREFQGIFDKLYKQAGYTSKADWL